MNRAGYKQVRCCDDLVGYVRDGLFARLELTDDDDSEVRMEISPEDVEEISHDLQRNTVLTVLSLNGVGLEDVGTMHLAKALQKNQTLRELELQDNEVGARGGAALGNMLGLNSTLRVLDLGANCLGPKGGIGIGKGLMNNGALRILLMCNNNIGYGAGGVEQLAKALRKNKTLRTLDLSNNKLGDDGALELASALASNQTLESLSLEFNQIKKHGADKLFQAMEKNHSLVFFNFGDNKTDTPFDRVVHRNQKRAMMESKMAFFEALEGNETTHWRRSKLMVIGHGKAGKTATVRSLLRKPFRAEWDSTVGVALTQSKTTLGQEWKVDNDTNFSVELANRIAVAKMREQRVVSPKTQKEHPREAKSFQGGSDGRRRFQPRRANEGYEEKEEEEADDELVDEMFRFQFWQQHLREEEEFEHEEDDEYDPEFDNDDYEEEDEGNEASDEEGDRMAKYDEDLFFAAKNERETLSMSIWDCGGQTVFHTLHHLFITRYAVYLLAFDMAFFLTHPEEGMRYVDFWLNSIKLHAAEAPVIIIGTFLDKLPKGKEKHHLEEVNQLLALDKKTYAANAVPNVAEALSFWPVSNFKAQGVNDLRNIVESVTLKQEYINIEVSVSWMRVLDAGKELQFEEWISVESLKAEVAKFGITSNAEIEQMCTLFHELGVVLYFSSSEVLKGLVILQPQWVIDAFCQVIRDRDLHQFNKKEIQMCGLTKDLKNLLQNGLVSRDLLEYLWSNTQVEYLLDLMHHLMLLSPWKFGNLEDELYLVPSMAVKDVAGYQGGQHANKVTFEFEFLPTGVYERLVCLCVEHSSSYEDSEEPKVGARFCSVWFGQKSHVQIVRGEASVEIFLAKAQDAPGLLNLLRKMMSKIKDDLMGSAFTWKTLVSSKAGMIALEEAKKNKVEPWCLPAMGKSSSVSAFNLDKFLS